MDNTLEKPSRRKLFFIPLGVLMAVLVIGLVVLSLPGEDTLVMNNTDRSISLNNCGDPVSQIPPGTVWDLKPGDQVYIPSGEFQKGNVCDVTYEDVHHTSQSSPDACLPLPPHGGGVVQVSGSLKPYPHSSNSLCDFYIKY